MANAYTKAAGVGNTSELYAAKIPSAYAASWQSEKLLPSSVAFSGLQGTGWDFFSGDIDFVTENTDNRLEFTVTDTVTPVQFGMTMANVVPKQVKISGSFSIPAGGTNVIIAAGGTTIYDAAPAGGEATFEGIATVDDTSGVSVDLLAMAAGLGPFVFNFSFEDYPPTIQPKKYSLNPAIPFHRILLGMPTEDFACIANVKFSNGGSVQSELNVALGVIPGRFIINPPSRLLTAGVNASGEVPTQYYFDNKSVRNTETDAFMSGNAALFEWSAIADAVEFSFSDFSVPADAGIIVGIMQMPQL